MSKIILVIGIDTFNQYMLSQIQQLDEKIIPIFNASEIRHAGGSEDRHKVLSRSSGLTFCQLIF